MPTITGTVANQAATDKQNTNALGGVLIGDTNTSAQENVTVTLTGPGGTATDANGTLGGTGLTKTGVGTYSVTPGTPAQVNPEIEQLIFTPTSGQVAPYNVVTTGFTITDVSSSTGSATNSTASVATTAVNDLPTFNGSVAGQATTDEAPVAPFATTAIADTAPGATEQLTITLLNALGRSTDANGTLSAEAGVPISPGIYRIAGSVAAVNATLASLVFTPTPHQVTPGQSVTTVFSLTDERDVGSTFAGRVSSTGNSVISTAVADNPTISGGRAGQTTVDRVPVRPFSAVTISDTGAGTPETVTITLTANGAATDADGTLTGSGLIRTNSGTYQLAGTPVAVTQAIDALTFVPSIGQVAPGATVTTGMTIAVARTGGAALDSSTSVAVTAASAAPSISGTVGGQQTTDVRPIAPFTTATIGEGAAGAIEAIIITLTNASSAPTDANGTLAGPGLSKTGIGTYALAAGPAASVTSQLRQAVFTPTALEVSPGQSVTTDLIIADTAAVGGVGPATIYDAGTSVIATAANTPFAQLVASDPTGTAVVAVQASLLGTAVGTFGNVGAGSVSADGKTYNISGTGAAVTAALASVVFTAGGGVATGVQGVISGSSRATLTDTGAGNNVLVGLGGQNSVVAGSGADTLFGASGVNTLFGGSGSDVIAAVSGPVVVLAGTGSSTIFGGGGPSTLIGGAGAATLVGGFGGTTIQGGSASDIIFDGNAAASINGGSTSATIVGIGAFNDTISVSANNDLIGVGNGNVVVSSGGVADTIVAGAGNDSIGVSGAALVFGEAGPLSLVTGAGASTLVGGAGSETVSVGTGGGTFYGGFSGNNLLTANASNTTLHGGGNGDVLQVFNTSDVLLVAGAGSETLNAAPGTGNVTLVGGSGVDLYQLGQGPTQVQGGFGGGTINPGGGADLLFFVNGTSGGSFVINGFKVGTDHVSLVGYSSRTTAVVNGSTVVTLPDSTTIAFAGMTNITPQSFV